MKKKRKEVGRTSRRVLARVYAEDLRKSCIGGTWLQDDSSLSEIATNENLPDGPPV